MKNSNIKINSIHNIFYSCKLFYKSNLSNLETIKGKFSLKKLVLGGKQNAFLKNG